MKQLKMALFVALLTMSACKSSKPPQSTSATQQSPQPTTQQSPLKQAVVFEMDEMEDLSCGEARKVWVARIKTLQLDNQLAKLEGRPQPNRMAIAKLETKIDQEDMLRNAEEMVIKGARILKKNDPDSAAALQDPEKTFLDSIRVARKVNASGSEAELKAALAKVDENNKAAQAAMEKIRRADCEKSGGVFVKSPTGSACKSN